MQSVKEKEIKRYLIGAGGHATVINDIANKQGVVMNGVFINEGAKNLTGLPYIDVIENISKYNQCEYILAFGNLDVRKQVVNDINNINIKWFSLISDDAVLAKDVTIGEGTVIMPGAIINAGAKIGNHVIINSGVIIEHGTIIGNHVHVSPGSTLCGNVTVGDGTWVCAGSTVIDGIEIGENNIIGAGSTVIRNIGNNQKVVGIPAKDIKVYKKK